jgi:hypothetical protein
MKKPEVENLVSDALFGTIGRGDLNILCILYLVYCRILCKSTFMNTLYISKYIYVQVCTSTVLSIIPFLMIM